MGFYAYMWLRENGTPFYVGKGTGKRAFVRRANHWPPKDPDRIIILARNSEAEAFETEKELIANWGRKDLGTGCLQNRTDGGENPPKGCLKGHKLSAEHKQKLRNAHLGKPNLLARGLKRSEETKRRMSKPRSRSWKLSEAAKKNQSKAASLREVKKKAQGVQCGQRRGYKHSAEAKQKISNAKTGKPSWNVGVSPSIETRAIWSSQRKGKKWSEERRKRHEEKKNGKL